MNIVNRESLEGNTVTTHPVPLSTYYYPSEMKSLDILKEVERWRALTGRVQVEEPEMRDQKSENVSWEVPQWLQGLI